LGNIIRYINITLSTFNIITPHSTAIWTSWFRLLRIYVHTIIDDLLTHALATVAPLVDGATGIADALEHADAFVATHALGTGSVRGASRGNTDALYFGVAGEASRTRTALSVAHRFAFGVDAASVHGRARIHTKTARAQLV